MPLISSKTAEQLGSAISVSVYPKLSGPPVFLGHRAGAVGAFSAPSLPLVSPCAPAATKVTSNKTTDNRNTRNNKNVAYTASLFSLHFTVLKRINNHRMTLIYLRIKNHRILRLHDTRDKKTDQGYRGRTAGDSSLSA